MSIGIIVAGISALISVIAVAVSLKTATDQRRLSRQLAEEEHRLLFEQVRVARDSDIIRWTSECLEVLAEIQSKLAFSSPSHNNSGEKADVKGQCHRLSALIDQGRMYFPNQAPESKGRDKPSAYQGQRQIILTVLVRIYDLVMKFDANGADGDSKKVVREFSDYRRRFVSEAQLALDPRRYIALKEMNDVKAGKGFQVQEPGEVEQI